MRRNRRQTDSRSVSQPAVIAPRSVWLLAVIVSASLFGLVVVLADWRIVTELLRQVPWWLLALGVAALMLEGVCSALRIKLLSRGPLAIRDCFVVTAWWVLGLALLPARLGELAGMHMLRRRLGASLGEALSNLSVQRLFDAAILFTVGAFAVAAQTQLVGRAHAATFSAIAAAALLLILWNLTTVFSVCARALRPWRHKRGIRLVLRTVLQARGAARRLLTRSRLAVIALVSLAKWSFNLGGIALVVLAFVPALAVLQSASVAIIYNLAAIIPLQTVGGIGIGEVSLSAGLAWYGYGAATAASAALLLRLVLLGAPILFWLIVVAIDRAMGLDDEP